MRKHPSDVVSLVMGLLLLSVGGLYLLTDVAHSGIDVRWAAPVLLIGIGLVGLTGSVRRRS
jgi:hypothetical protein